MVHLSPFKETLLSKRLRSRSAVFGMWNSFYHPSITEIFARTGPDFIGIDLEHSTINLSEGQRIIAAAQAGGAACLPRVASHNGEQIRQLLDSGADGILVPNVNRPEEVERIVEWCKYPPVGRRGFGVARAQGYGFDFDDYVSRWNDRSTLILQIESIDGVAAIDRLLNHPAVDGIMVGPYDISGSLGVPGQLDHPRVMEACLRLIGACREQGKGCGTHLVEPTPERVNEAFEMGYTFLVLGSDLFLLWKWAEAMRALIQARRLDGAP